jgi:hypothetical protein
MKDHEKQQQTALLAYQFWMEKRLPVGSPLSHLFHVAPPTMLVREV